MQRSASVTDLLPLLCYPDAVVSFAASEALRKRASTAADELTAELLVLNCTAALRLLKSLLKTPGPAQACVSTALERGLPTCLRNACGDEERLTFACKLARCYLRRTTIVLSAPAAACCCEAAFTLLPPTVSAYGRHAALSLLLALHELQGDSIADACAGSLELHASDLLAVPADAPPDSLSSPFFCVSTDGLRRRALLLALLTARNVLPVAWQRAAEEDVYKTAASLGALLDAEDDVYLKALCACAALHARLRGPAAALCDPARLLSMLLRSTRNDPGVIVDMLMSEDCAVSLLTLLLHALRHVENSNSSRVLLGGPALRCLAALRRRLARLVDSGLFPFNAAPLLRRLEYLECN